MNLFVLRKLFENLGPLCNQPLERFYFARGMLREKKVFALLPNDTKHKDRFSAFRDLSIGAEFFENYLLNVIPMDLAERYIPNLIPFRLAPQRPTPYQRITFIEWACHHGNDPEAFPNLRDFCKEVRKNFNMRLFELLTSTWEHAERGARRSKELDPETLWQRDITPNIVPPNEVHTLFFKKP